MAIATGGAVSNDVLIAFCSSGIEGGKEHMFRSMTCICCAGGCVLFFQKCNSNANV